MNDVCSSRSLLSQPPGHQCTTRYTLLFIFQFFYFSFFSFPPLYLILLVLLPTSQFFFSFCRQTFHFDGGKLFERKSMRIRHVGDGLFAGGVGPKCPKRIFLARGKRGAGWSKAGGKKYVLSSVGK